MLCDQLSVSVLPSKASHFTRQASLPHQGLLRVCSVFQSQITLVMHFISHLAQRIAENIRTPLGKLCCPWFVCCENISKGSLFIYELTFFLVCVTSKDLVELCRLRSWYWYSMYWKSTVKWNCIVKIFSNDMKGLFHPKFYCLTKPHGTVFGYRLCMAVQKVFKIAKHFANSQDHASLSVIAR